LVLILIWLVLWLLSSLHHFVVAVVGVDIVMVGIVIAVVVLSFWM